MKLFFSILITVIITAVATIFLYEPASVLIFKITEPSFGSPIKSPSGHLAIRHDVFGSGDFGAKRNGGRSHSGVDISAEVGTPVYASKSGIVFRGNIPTGYGKYVLLYHPDGTQTMYGHLSNWAVNTGKKVHKGELIGFVGKTGNAANKNIQPHLHFEIRADGDPVDPAEAIR
ncbi:MAG: M23 family metallopeptidase [Candidatus Omnitrophica bacterium]|nr:M23 family metallopeptidase [Candidatus Omnitrophota bacterium]